MLKKDQTYRKNKVKIVMYASPGFVSTLTKMQLLSR